MSEKRFESIGPSTLRLNRRSFVGATAAAGAGVVLTGTGAVDASSKSQSPRRIARLQADPKTLVIAMDGSPSDLDPSSAYDYRSVLAIQGMYEGLIGLKDEKTDELIGLIAESWVSNEDLSTWTFTLRDGVTFHDGSPCDSAAVLANYERVFTLGLGPIGVMGRFISDYKTQISAPDAKTIVFNLGRPQPLFPYALASTYANPIVNVQAAKAHEVDGDFGHIWLQTNAEGTGTGPYKIVEFTPDDKLVMERNEAYWGGWEGDHFDSIVLRVVSEPATRRQLLESGDADIVDSLTAEDVKALQENPDITLLRGFSTQVEYFPMTVAGPLETIEARQALCYAMPYDDVVNGVFGGYAKQAQGCVAELCRGFAPGTFQFTTDLVKAKELLTTAGVAEGTKLTIRLETGIESRRASAQLLQANLAEIGIELELDLVDLPTFTASFYGDAPIEERPNLFSWAWWPDYNDAWNHCYPQVSSEAWGSVGANAGFYANTKVDELLATAKDAPDDESYQAAMTELQAIIAESDPPAIYYVQPQVNTLHRNDVTGVFLNPINIGTYNFWKMSRTAGS